MKRKMITLATAILTLSLATACGSETPNTESTAANESVSVAVATQTSEDTSTSVEGSEESSVEPTEVVEESKSYWKDPATYVPTYYPYSTDPDSDEPDQKMWIDAYGQYWFGYPGDLEMQMVENNDIYDVLEMVNKTPNSYAEGFREALNNMCKAEGISLDATTTTSTEVLTAKTEVVNGMYVLPEEEYVNGVCFTVNAPASYVARNLISYGGLTCQFIYENMGGIITAPPTNPDEIYNPMVSSLNDLLHYSWNGTTFFVGAGNSVDIDDNKNREVSQGIMNFLSKYNIVDSTGYISPKYGSITLHEKVTTPNGLVIAKNTDKIYEFDFNKDLGNVPTDLSTYKEIGTAAITYRFYFKTADGNFNDLYYVSVYGAEDKVLAAIDEYAAQYGLTQ